MAPNLDLDRMIALNFEERRLGISCGLRYISVVTPYRRPIRSPPAPTVRASACQAASFSRSAASSAVVRSRGFASIQASRSSRR